MVGYIMSKMLNILIWLVRSSWFFWGVVRDYRCSGLTRWASSIPPQSAATCLSFILFRSHLPVTSMLVPVPSSIQSNLKSNQSYLDEPHLDLEDKLN